MKSIERSRQLRALMKKEIFPWLESRGFKPIRHSGLWYGFTRQQSGQLQIVDIQWDRYHRPKFAVNFGQTPVVMQNGEAGYRNRYTGEWLPLAEASCGGDRSYRLAYGRLRWQWFRYPWLASLLPSGGPQAAINRVLELLPVMEGWFAGDPASIAMVESMNVTEIADLFKK